jgi:hypothetical protein
MKITEALIDASMEVGLEVNNEKTNHMLMSYHQTAGQNHNIETASRSSENVAQFIYLETTVTNQNFIQDKIKTRLNLGNACYHSVQKLLFPHLLSKNIKIKIHKNTILSVFCMGVKHGLSQ